MPFGLARLAHVSRYPNLGPSNPEETGGPGGRGTWQNLREASGILGSIGESWGTCLPGTSFPSGCHGTMGSDYAAAWASGVRVPRTTRHWSFSLELEGLERLLLEVLVPTYVARGLARMLPAAATLT